MKKIAILFLSLFILLSLKTTGQNQSTIIPLTNNGFESWSSGSGYSIRMLITSLAVTYDYTYPTGWDYPEYPVNETLTLFGQNVNINTDIALLKMSKETSGVPQGSAAVKLQSFMLSELVNPTVYAVAQSYLDESLTNSAFPTVLSTGKVDIDALRPMVDEFTGSFSNPVQLLSIFEGRDLNTIITGGVSLNGEIMGRLTGYYKYTSGTGGGDNGGILILGSKFNPATHQREVVGAGYKTDMTDISSYTPFEINYLPLSEIDETKPYIQADSIVIMIFSSANTEPKQGSALYLDNLQLWSGFPPAPDTCSAVMGLSVNSVDTTHASMGWTYEGTPDHFEAEYGTHGFVQGSGTPATPTGSTLSLSNLTPDTDYDVYVRSVCEDDIMGEWAMTTFHTDMLPVIIPDPTYGDTTATACGSFNWYGENLTASGNYPHLFEGGNALGGDSTVTLHLTIHVPTYGDTTATALDSFNWYGENLTASGNYPHLFENGNANGCDSTVTLHLTILSHTYGDTTATACGSFNWYGENLTTSGDYPHLFEGGNATGGDSTVTLHLTIHVPTFGDTTATACGSFSWYGENLTTSGTYPHLIENGNANGCDSTVTLHLTINHGTYNTIDTTVCDSYEWHDSIYTESGTYVFEYTNETDCPSADTLHLTVTTIDTDISGLDGWMVVYEQENATYQWMNCETNELIEGVIEYVWPYVQFIPDSAGYYACIITIGECTDTTECRYYWNDGISENSTANLILYPNPTTGIVTVNMTPETMSLNPEIQVFDMYGRMLSVVETMCTSSLQTMEIDLSRYANGIYLLKVVDNGKVIAVGKVVKE